MKAHPHLSTADLVARLSERGLAFVDLEGAERTLRNVNYYRFTGYSRYFQADPRNGNQSYESGVSFEDVLQLMALDDELRLRLMVPISEVEMSIRTRFAHLAGRHFGDDAFYVRASNHISVTDETSQRIHRIAEDLRSSKQATVQHYRDGEDISAVPIWVAVEVLSFGKISWLVESLDSNPIREQLAAHFSHEHSTLPRTLQSLADLRNLCAHHGQLWNRKVVSQCPLPINKRLRPRGISYDPQGLYPAVMALQRLTASPASKAQLGAVERRLTTGGRHAVGVLSPSGIR